MPVKGLEIAAVFSSTCRKCRLKLSHTAEIQIYSVSKAPRHDTTGEPDWCKPSIASKIQGLFNRGHVQRDGEETVWHSRVESKASQRSFKNPTLIQHWSNNWNLYILWKLNASKRLRFLVPSSAKRNRIHSCIWAPPGPGLHGLRCLRLPSKYHGFGPRDFGWFRHRFDVLRTSSNASISRTLRHQYHARSISRKLSTSFDSHYSMKFRW